MNLWNKLNDINEVINLIPVKVPREFYTIKRDYGSQGKLVDYLVSRFEVSSVTIKYNNPDFLFIEMTDIIKEIFDSFCDGQYNCGQIIALLSETKKVCAQNVLEAIEKLYKLRVVYFVKDIGEINHYSNEIRETSSASAFAMEILFSYIFNKFGIPYMFAPSKFTFIITNKCNANCKTCYRGNISISQDSKYKKELTTQEVFSIIDYLSQIGTDRIKFLGGEPFCRRDIFELISYAHTKNMITEVSSNGLAFTNDEYINELKNLNNVLFNLQISIDGLEKSHDQQRTGADFHKLVYAFDKMKSAGIQFTTNTIVSRINMNEIDEFIKFLSQYNIFSRFQIMKACGMGVKNFSNIPTPFEKQEIIKSINTAKEKYKANVSNAVIFHPFVQGLIRPRSDIKVKYHRCRSCTYGMALSPEGYALPCEFLEPFSKFVCENVKEKSILDIWHESEIFKALRYVEVEGKCFDCEYSYNCEMGCFAETYSLTNKISSSDPVCWYDPKNPKVYFPKTNSYIMKNCKAEG